MVETTIARRAIEDAASAPVTTDFNRPGARKMAEMTGLVTSLAIGTPPARLILESTDTD
jgi:hypothetical protein